MERPRANGCDFVASHPPKVKAHPRPSRRRREYGEVPERPGPISDRMRCDVQAFADRPDRAVRMQALFHLGALVGQALTAVLEIAKLQIDHRGHDRVVQRIVLTKVWNTKIRQNS